MIRWNITYSDFTDAATTDQIYKPWGECWRAMPLPKTDSPITGHP